MFKPFHTLLFVGSVFSILAGLAYLSPDAQLFSSSSGISFPALKALLAEKETKKDISAILALADKLDTSEQIKPTTDSITLAPGDSVPLNMNLQYKQQSCLHSFYNALKVASPSTSAFHILHYGDSQIEADRISDYLRQKLQQQFGGSGPGLMSLMPLSATVSNKLTWTGTWDRFATYTSKDKRVPHQNYGVLASFCRFKPFQKLNDTTQISESTLQITTSKNGGSNVFNYSRVKLFYGGSQTKTWCEFYDGVALNAADSLNVGGNFHLREYNVVPGSGQHKFQFKGKDSPDFYALSLEGTGGVMVDNIPLRGSSGTFFHLVNNGQLKNFYEHLNVKCIVLQFGGNTLPAIKDEVMAKNFGDYMRGQIAIVKRLAPQASIIVIGPADMSMKEGTDYVTYPMLESLRNSIKQAAFDSNCAFFDMYDCMGGKNSMSSWVEQKLAAADYIHFSPQGARKIATLLYSALIKDYNSFLKTQK
jgi:lysophospholipase L1-like esterase